ncbi:hypothetical protein J2D73_05135 [Acetobacter sacchari]|uniref:Uncharacterized protein n=1 Tax=Acetobacter sacchari TaxID=2661687 RepID=A0ABS3LTE3_9PROT|nr:hypothetical protein [Acetobacter sacchari]MBO1359180.1 hypothetical protein [Acetobacter sacchari]
MSWNIIYISMLVADFLVYHVSIIVCAVAAIHLCDFGGAGPTREKRNLIRIVCTLPIFVVGNAILSANSLWNASQPTTVLWISAIPTPILLGIKFRFFYFERCKSVLRKWRKA